MATWISTTSFDEDPQQLGIALTEVDAIERWSPVPFRIAEERPRQLCAGAQIAVEGVLVGRGVRFDVAVERAGANGLSLRAYGPIEIDIEYIIDRDVGRLTGRVDTRGSGLLARLLLAATNALLSAGALDHALHRIVREAHEQTESHAQAA